MRTPKIIFAIQFLTLHGLAQQSLSLQQCINYANGKNFGLRTQEARNLQAENNLEQSKKAILPSIYGNVSQGLNAGRSIDPFSNSFIQTANFANNLGLSANLTLFNGFTNQYQIEQNRYELSAEHAETTRLKRDLKTNITLAFMQVLMNQELSKIAQEQVQDLKNQQFRLMELLREGNIPRTDLIDLDAQLATAEFDAINAKNNIENSKLVLSGLMSFPSTNFDLEEVKLEESSLLITGNYTKTILQNISTQPLLKAKELRLESSKMGIRLAQATRYPNVSLLVGIGSAYASVAKSQFDYFKQLGYNFNQYGSVRVSIPIYSAGQIQGKIRSAELAQKVAEIDLSQSKFSLTQEIQQAVQFAKTAQEKLSSAKRQLYAQQMAFEAARGRYAEGLLHSIELNAFRLNLEKAKSSLIQSKYEFHFRNLVLGFYNKP